MSSDEKVFKTSADELIKHSSGGGCSIWANIDHQMALTLK